ncbi:MAG TPA: family 15 carbohydrate-binding domain-containing protein, partial [Cellvibrio sp.]
MRHIQRAFYLSLIALGLTACGGSGGGNSSTPASSTPASSVAPSSIAASSIAPSSTPASSVAPSSVAPSSTPASSIAVSSSSAAATQVNLSMTSGWRGNGNGNTGVTYNSDGVSFTASGDDIGAVTDIAAPIQLEDAIITMVVNVSSEFKASGANLQPFAQIKGGSWAGEWNCWAGNELFTAGTDATITCTVAEADK